LFDRDDLVALLRHWRRSAGFQTPLEKVVSGVPDDLACRRPLDMPNSILDLTWHMSYWTEFAARALEDPSFDLHGDQNVDWPSLAATESTSLEWQALSQRFITALIRLEEAVEGARDEALADGDRGAPLALAASAHNLHHAGQIISLRRLLGCWADSAGT